MPITFLLGLLLLAQSAYPYCYYLSCYPGIATNKSQLGSVIKSQTQPLSQKVAQLNQLKEQYALALQEQTKTLSIYKKVKIINSLALMQLLDAKVQKRKLLDLLVSMKLTESETLWLSHYYFRKTGGNDK